MGVTKPDVALVNPTKVDGPSAAGQRFRDMDESVVEHLETVFWASWMLTQREGGSGEGDGELNQSISQSVNQSINPLQYLVPDYHSQLGMREIVSSGTGPGHGSSGDSNGRLRGEEEEVAASSPLSYFPLYPFGKVVRYSAQL
ncbi:hypothetical protein AXG93_4751s1190 [Marchantia polymorpha subsp. ruderalis]|uniref:Uncharacterized protein n=1 Tax=Marchantia polymorpha subsp. ruderalis TaxID=1480154 RepID=A0A176VE89_MARPO|nr:hypothetical protein AXG93_4751s1190 [Marchantia polymorpha subsp. ruderalis]